MVFDGMMMQCAISELIAQAFTQKRHHQNLSVILIIQNLYCQGKVMRMHLNTEYVVLFGNPQESIWEFAKTVGTETLQSTCGRLRGRHIATVLASPGGSETSHSRCTGLHK